MKGLIQAVGVLMHVEQGRMDSANRLAAKARDLFKQHGRLLPFDGAELLDALEEGRHRAPRLFG